MTTAPRYAGQHVTNVTLTILAKQWALHRTPMLFALGAVSFLGLFAIYALTLGVADLSTVTFGWIVCLQVAVLVVERTHYGVRLPPPSGSPSCAEPAVVGVRRPDQRVSAELNG